MNKLIRLAGGLRLALYKMKGTGSVSVGVYVGAGSANETERLNGISHFIEHMMFKGTKTRTAFKIAEEMEMVGAQINAFTSREMTAYYTLSVAAHLSKCMEMLSDIFFNSTFTEENMEKEKCVVLEEINMCEDDPSDLCQDLLSLAFFGKRGLGQPILGTAENVKAFTREDILNYIGDYYTADNVVISVAGNIDYDEVTELAEKYFAEPFEKKERLVREKYEVAKVGRVQSKIKQIEQTNVAFGFPSYKMKNKDVMAVALLSSIMGGGMSSRLFQKLREEIGLVYDVYSTHLEYTEKGYFVIYLAMNPASAKQAVEAVKEVICALKTEGISENEFIKSKEQLKASLVLGAERSVSVMRAIAAKELLEKDRFSIKKSLERIDAVTRDDLKRVTDYIFRFDKMAVGYVGKEKFNGITAIFDCE